MYKTLKPCMLKYVYLNINNRVPFLFSRTYFFLFIPIYSVSYVFFFILSRGSCCMFPYLVLNLTHTFLFFLIFILIYHSSSRNVPHILLYSNFTNAYSKQERKNMYSHMNYDISMTIRTCQFSISRMQLQHAQVNQISWNS